MSGLEDVVIGLLCPGRLLIFNAISLLKKNISIVFGLLPYPFSEKVIRTSIMMLPSTIYSSLLRQLVLQNFCRKTLYAQIKLWKLTHDLLPYAGLTPCLQNEVEEMDCLRKL